MPYTYDCTDTGWIITSPGPDGIYSIVPGEILRGVPGTTETRLLHLTYDPTNGTVSPGDIWRMPSHIEMAERARSGMQAVAGAIEAYHVSHDSYPTTAPLARYA